MFFFKKTKPTVATPAKSPLVTDEQINFIIKILTPFGLSLDDGFREHIVNSNSYSGGSFEWTERGHRMRYIFKRNFTSQKMYKVIVTSLRGKDTLEMSEAQDAINSMLQN
jgi:predicted Ser/Thr protein kinase